MPVQVGGFVWKQSLTLTRLSKCQTGRSLPPGGSSGDLQNTKSKSFSRKQTGNAAEFIAGLVRQPARQVIGAIPSRGKPETDSKDEKIGPALTTEKPTRRFSVVKPSRCGDLSITVAKSQKTPNRARVDSQIKPPPALTEREQCPWRTALHGPAYLFHRAKWHGEGVCRGQISLRAWSIL
jgi:hypothetical protein